MLNDRRGGRMAVAGGTPRALLAPVLLCLVLLGAGRAAAEATRPADQVRDLILGVDRAAATLSEAATATRLASAFGVRPRQVLDLLDQKLDPGEVAVVLALAEASRTPSDRILGLWASVRLDWAEIAERLKVDTPALFKRLDTVRRELASPRIAR